MLSSAITGPLTRRSHHVAGIAAANRDVSVHYADACYGAPAFIWPSGLVGILAWILPGILILRQQQRASEPDRCHRHCY